ncbi:MAG: PaaI family thioesterase [Syntrophomonadaceae bacterium]|jgi:uncharacterized protein (TIGR00369 family)|nr:PaaI family thioesterase [Syntrophomonadaceae bacterium]
MPSPGAGILLLNTGTRACAIIYLIKRNGGVKVAAVNGGIDQRLFDYLLHSLGKTPYYHLLGLKLVRLSPGQSEFEVLTEEKHCNPLGLLHGGLIMSIADAAMGNAIRSLGITGVTVDISVAMIAAVPHGSVLQAIGKVRKAGKTVIFTDAEVWCENRLVGQAKGTFVNHGPVEYK